MNNTEPQSMEGLEEASGQLFIFLSLNFFLRIVFIYIRERERT